MKNYFSNYVKLMLCGSLLLILVLPVDGLSNQPPVLTVHNPEIVGYEGQVVKNTGTISDPDGDPVTLSTDRGTVTNNGDGTWSWSDVCPIGDPGGAWGVTITADDGQGGIADIWFQFCRIPTQDEILPQIDLSLSWLVGEQKGDGCWNGPYHPEGPQIDEPVACTGFVLTKLCDYAYEHGYDSPFDPQYGYSQNVIAGYNYLFKQARTHGSGTGIFMHENLTDDHHENYNAAVSMMGIAASLTPNREIVSSNSLVDGLTFLQLLNEMITYFEHSQSSDLSYVAYGGWGYAPGDDTYSDNSNTGYVVLGLRYAEAIGCVIPQQIKDKLNNWIDYIQNDSNGGSGYWIPDEMVNMLETGNLLFEMAFVGDNVEDDRVQDALDFIGNNWDYPSDDPYWRNIRQAQYCLMKGFESFSIDYINVDGEDRNWFDEFVAQLYFINSPTPEGFWYFSAHGDRLLATCWALFVLEKVVPNLPPIITAIAVPPEPVPFSDQPVKVRVTYTDPDGSADDDYTVTFDYGDETSETVIDTGFSCTVDYTYDEPGVYTVTVTVMDKDGGSDTDSATEYIVIYDATEGFVTGGGWIDSPEGAYTADPDLTGKANFGFVSKYKKGQSTPDGNTEFQFHAADINFHSSSYDWLVIAGHKAMYKGVGTIDGDGNFGFQLSAIDANLTPSTDVDLFRIRIWDKDDGDVLVYDNKVGETDPNGEPTTAIGGGNIKIHKGKLKKENSEDGMAKAITAIPENYSLSQNYPNPFNPSTTIDFTLPEKSPVSLIVYNIQGSVIRTLVEDARDAGFYRVQWDGKDSDGKDVAAGLYFCTIKTVGFQKTIRMLYVK